MMPEFKYAAKVDFLEELRHEHPSIKDEALTVMELAQTVDSDWTLDRTHCDVLCHFYQRFAELLFKMTLEGWARDDEKFPHHVFTRKRVEGTDEARYTTSNHKFWFKKRFKATHSLSKLQESIQTRTDFAMVTSDESLQRIGNCAADTMYGEDNFMTRISCADFFFHSSVLDEYIMDLLDFIKTTPPVNSDYDTEGTFTNPKVSVFIFVLSCFHTRGCEFSLCLFFFSSHSEGNEVMNTYVFHAGVINSSFASSFGRFFSCL
jgi:hypothetical protein